MAEIPDVVGGEVIEIGWGNPIRDRTVQRYVDGTERDTLVPVPVVGDLSYLTATGAFEIWDGSAWIRYIPETGGTFAGPIEFRSTVSINEQGNPSAIRMFFYRTVYDVQYGTELGITARSGIEGAFYIRPNMNDSQHSFDFGVDGFYFPGGEFRDPIKVSGGITDSVGGQDRFVETTSLETMLPAGTVDAVGIYLATTPGNGHGATGAIESGWIDGTQPSMEIGLVRDSLKGSIRFNHSGTSEFRANGTVVADWGVGGIVNRNAVASGGFLRNIYAGTTPPDPGLGDVGDVYMQVGSV